MGGLTLHFCYYIYSSVSFAVIATHNVLVSLTRQFDGQKGWECGETNCSEVCC